MAANATQLLLGTSQLVSAYSSVEAAKSSADALRLRGEADKFVYDTNARVSEMQAQDALQRGDKAVTQVKRQVRQTVGAQRAALAAQGVDVNEGSAVDLQAETAGFGALDALTIKNNAYREAWGYKTQALQSSLRGELALSSSRVQANNTILTGGLNALSYGLKAGAYFSAMGGGRKDDSSSLAPEWSSGQVDYYPGQGGNIA